jgi:hypothetical protein
LQHLRREKSLEHSFLKWSNNRFNLRKLHHDPFFSNLDRYCSDHHRLPKIIIIYPHKLNINEKGGM